MLVPLIKLDNNLVKPGENNPAMQKGISIKSAKGVGEIKFEKMVYVGCCFSSV